LAYSPDGLVNGFYTHVYFACRFFVLGNDKSFRILTRWSFPNLFLEQYEPEGHSITDDTPKPQIRCQGKVRDPPFMAQQVVSSKVRKIKRKDLRKGFTVEGQEHGK
jgi:hypothetical protein